MTLPVFLAPDSLAQAQVGEPLRVGAEVAGHAVRVRRMGPGDHLDIIDGAGTRVRGEITDAQHTELTLTVTEVAREPEPKPRLVLVQALAKGDRDIQAIEAATEVGVDAVIPWAATRSIADWPAKKAAKMKTKWFNTLTAATLQSRRSRIPHLSDLLRGNHLDTLCQPNTAVLILHETATQSLPDGIRQATAPHSLMDTIYLVVGPEGGISPTELASAQHAGAYPVVLGDTVLRASTAGPVALGIVQTLLGRWA